MSVINKMLRDLDARRVMMPGISPESAMRLATPRWGQHAPVLPQLERPKRIYWLIGFVLLGLAAGAGYLSSRFIPLDEDSPRPSHSTVRVTSDPVFVSSPVPVAVAPVPMPVNMPPVVPVTAPAPVVTTALVSATPLAPIANTAAATQTPPKPVTPQVATTQLTGTNPVATTTTTAAAATLPVANKPVVQPTQSVPAQAAAQMAAVPKVQTAPAQAATAQATPMPASPTVVAKPLPAPLQAAAPQTMQTPNATAPAAKPLVAAAPVQATPVLTQPTLAVQVKAPAPVPAAPVSTTATPAVLVKTTLPAAPAPRIEPAKPAAPVATMSAPNPQPAVSTAPKTPAVNPMLATPAAPVTQPNRQAATQETLAQAQSLWNSGSHEAALDLMREAVAVTERAYNSGTVAADAPVLVSLVRELTRMELAEGRPVRVLELLIRLEPALSKQADLWAVRGNAAQRLSRHQESVMSYAKALAIRPDEPRWMLASAVSLAALGRLDESAIQADKANAAGVVSPEILSYLKQVGVPVGPK